jgi:hypothetical protein
MAAANSYDEITIQGQVFRVANRYKIGDTLSTEGEVNALNQTLHENLRNNFAKRVTEGVEANVPKETLQQQLDDYANDYQFGVRGPGGFRGDQVMTVSMNIARQMVRDAIKSKGIDQDEWPASRISQAAKALLDSQGDDGKIIATARRQVEAEKEAAREAMASVNELLDQPSAQAAQ